MPWDDYVAQPFVQKHELSKQLVDICKAKEDETYFGFSPVPIASKLPDQKSFLYLNDRDLEGSEVWMSLTTQKYTRKQHGLNDPQNYTKEKIQYL